VYLARSDGEAKLHRHARLGRLLQADWVGGEGSARSSVGGRGERNEGDRQKDGCREGSDCDH
jgi:hypothetical protein